jgi:hypothetical protein
VNDKLVEGEMEVDVDKTTPMRNLRQSSTVQTVIEYKRLKNVKYFKYLGSLKSVQDVHMK